MPSVGPGLSTSRSAYRRAYDLLEIRHWLALVSAAILRQSVQALGFAEWSENVLRWLALPAGRLASPGGCGRGCVACGAGRERARDVTAGVHIAGRVAGKGAIDDSVCNPGERGRSRMLVAGPRFRLFALQATADFGTAVAQALGCKLAAHEEREFEDGEHKARPLDAGRRRQCLRRPEPARRPFGNGKRQALPAPVLHRSAQGCRRRPCHGGRAISLLCPKGSSHQAERSGHHPLHRRHVRGGRDRLRRHARGPQPGRLRERLPLPHHLADRAHRCSSITCGP